MSTITYENLHVNGLPFEKVLYLHIHHEQNSHGRAEIKGVVSREQVRRLAEQTDETTGIEITTDAEDQPKCLFYGVISMLNAEQQAEYAVLHIVAETASSRIDAKKNSRTFQNTGKTYGQILNQVLGGKGTVSVMVTDRPIGALIMQCDETDWEFIVRMASQLGVPAFANITARMPQIYIGLPPASRTREIQTLTYDYVKSNSEYRTSTAASVLGEDFSSDTIKSYDYLYLGDTVLFEGKSLQVKAVDAKLSDGILECTYSLGLKTSFQVNAIKNRNASGRMMTGRVTAVKADKVQVFLHSVDSEEDGGSNWWFPYSTAYSSGDGSGWYSMPAVGDEIRVFFPSGNEGDAFAASAVAKNVRAKTTDKCWSGLNGKQILMTEEGLVIICREGKMYIKLSDDKGIEIISDMDINITSGTKVNIQGGEEVKIIAESEVLVGTATSYLDIRKEGITANAENIILN